jgi:hypothetical protein
MEKLVETLGITRLSKSLVSVMAQDLDAPVEAFRTRPLDAGPYTFVAADALVLKGLFTVPGEWSAEMIAHAAIRAALFKRLRGL